MDKKTYLKLTIGIGLIALWVVAVIVLIIGIIDKEPSTKLVGNALFIIGGLIQAISMEIIK